MRVTGWHSAGGGVAREVKEVRRGSRRATHQRSYIVVGRGGRRRRTADPHMVYIAREAKPDRVHAKPHRVQSARALNPNGRVAENGGGLVNANCTSDEEANEF